MFQIDVPPLGERGMDIEKLASAFLGTFSKQNGINLQPLSDQDINRLNSYNWPGNIRELQNVVERAVITSIDGTLNLEQALPETSSPDNPVIAASIMDNENVISDKELKDLEKANILRALNKTDWKISGKEGAAVMLGIPTSTINSKIKSFDIKRPE